MTMRLAQAAENRVLVDWRRAVRRLAERFV
jgi:hypothetical protein